MSEREFFEELQEFEYSIDLYSRGKLEDLSGNKSKKLCENFKSVRLSDEEINDIIYDDYGEHDN